MLGSINNKNENNLQFNIECTRFFIGDKVKLSLLKEVPIGGLVIFEFSYFAEICSLESSLNF